METVRSVAATEVVGIVARIEHQIRRPVRQRCRESAQVEDLGRAQLDQRADGLVLRSTSCHA